MAVVVESLSVLLSSSSPSLLKNFSPVSCHSPSSLRSSLFLGRRVRGEKGESLGSRGGGRGRERGPFGPQCATGRVGFGGRRGGDKTLPLDKDLKGWTQVFEAESMEEGKNRAAIINKKGFVVLNLPEKLLAVEANCPACQFPVINGKVEKSDGGSALECPLCRSKFSLPEGTVLEWCPKKGVLTSFIGTLKGKADRENLKVFPATRSEGGFVYISLKK